MARQEIGSPVPVTEKYMTRVRRRDDPLEEGVAAQIFRPGGSGNMPSRRQEIHEQSWQSVDPIESYHAAPLEEPYAPQFSPPVNYGRSVCECEGAAPNVRIPVPLRPAETPPAGLPQLVRQPAYPTVTPVTPEQPSALAGTPTTPQKVPLSGTPMLVQQPVPTKITAQPMLVQQPAVPVAQPTLVQKALPTLQVAPPVEQPMLVQQAMQPPPPPVEPTTLPSGQQPPVKETEKPAGIVGLLYKRAAGALQKGRQPSSPHRWAMPALATGSPSVARCIELYHTLPPAWQAWVDARTAKVARSASADRHFCLIVEQALTQSATQVGTFGLREPQPIAATGLEAAGALRQRLAPVYSAGLSVGHCTDLYQHLSPRWQAWVDLRTAHLVRSSKSDAFFCRVVQDALHAYQTGTPVRAAGANPQTSDNMVFTPEEVAGGDQSTGGTGTPSGQGEQPPSGQQPLPPKLATTPRQHDALDWVAGIGNIVEHGFEAYLRYDQAETATHLHEEQMRLDNELAQARIRAGQGDQSANAQISQLQTQIQQNQTATQSLADDIRQAIAQRAPQGTPALLWGGLAAAVLVLGVGGYLLFSRRRTA